LPEMAAGGVSKKRRSRLSHGLGGRGKKKHALIRQPSTLVKRTRVLNLRWRFARGEKLKLSKRQRRLTD